MITFAPVLTSEAGSTLTYANWQEIGIDIATFHLQALLLKPGLAYLKTLPSLSHYCGWEKAIVLNARLPQTAERGLYGFRSPFDGSWVEINKDELLTLIVSLNPQKVILPEGFANNWNAENQWFPSHIETFIPINEESSYQTTGYYHDANWLQPLNRPQALQDKPLYWIGEGAKEALLSLEFVSVLVESNEPAQQGMIGQAFSGHGLLHLLSEEFAHQHQLIANACACPTCEQGFTRSYLHHLLGHTPLLAQRLLIHHNAYYYQHHCLGT